MEFFEKNPRMRSGTRAERLAITTPALGEEFHETDYDAVWKGTGSTWRLIQPVVSVANDPNGNYPANNFTDLNPAPTTALAVFTVTGLQGMHSGQFNFTLVTETILLEALDSSGNNLGPILVENINVGVAGAMAAATALAAGAYRIAAPFTGASLRCTKSAAVNSITFNGFLSGAA